MCFTCWVVGTSATVSLSHQDITNSAGKIENLDEFPSHRANIFNHVNQFDIAQSGSNIILSKICYDTLLPRYCYFHA